MKKSDFKNLEELLISLYVDQELSTRDVARKLNVCQTTIRRWLEKYNIRTRKPDVAKTAKPLIEKRKKLGEYYKIVYTKQAFDNNSRIIAICPTCGKSFEKLKSSKKVFCSRQCSGIAKRKTHFCKRCGKPLTNHWAKYCPECIHVVRIENNYNRIETTCAECGKTLYIIPSVYYKNINNFCNVECMSKYYSKHYSGENSPAWKGGKRHYAGHWLKSRDDARERDNYTCQLCGVTENEWHKEMDVHHIKNYRLFEDKERANELSNLVCLCNKCHSFVHSKLNTEKLFIEE